MACRDKKQISEDRSEAVGDGTSDSRSSPRGAILSWPDLQDSDSFELLRHKENTCHASNAIEIRCACPIRGAHGMADCSALSKTHAPSHAAICGEEKQGIGSLQMGNLMRVEHAVVCGDLVKETIGDACLVAG